MKLANSRTGKKTFRIEPGDIPDLEKDYFIPTAKIITPRGRVDYVPFWDMPTPREESKINPESPATTIKETTTIPNSEIEPNPESGETSISSSDSTFKADLIFGDEIIIDKSLNFDVHEPKIDRIVLANLLDCIDLRRFFALDTMLIIGKVIYNVFKGYENEGLAYWAQQTEARRGLYGNHPKEDEEFFGKHWEKFGTRNPFSLKTLYVMAMEDRPKDGQKCNRKNITKWMDQFIVVFLEKALHGGHFYVANVVYWTHMAQFIYTGYSGGWYEFTGNCWIKGEKQNNPNLSTFISRGLPKLFLFLKQKDEAFVRTTREMIKNMTNPLEKAKYEADLKPLTDRFAKIDAMVAKLADNRFKQAVMKECCDLFYDPNFMKFRDCFPFITAYQNTSVVATEKDCYLRRAYPDEYVTKFVPLVIPTGAIDWGNPNIAALMKWFKSIYVQVKPTSQKQDSEANPNNLKEENSFRAHASREKLEYDEKATEEMVRYILGLWSSAFQGVNHKIFIVMTGEGNNSKSMLKMIHKMIFGPMCQDLDFGSLEGTKNATGASPGLAKLEGAKEVWLSEPNEGKALTDGVIKLLTGGDSFFARGTYSNGADITACCLLFLTCNAIPSIPANIAMKNRVQIIPHMSVWCKDAPVDEDEQLNSRRFPEDPFFQKTLEDLAPYFVQLLVWSYNENIGKKPKIPECIEIATKKFWGETDCYILFKEEMVVKAIIPGSDAGNESKPILDPTAKISKSEMFRNFSNWFRNTYPTSSLPSRTSVLNALQRIIPEGITTDGWIGHVLLSEKSVGKFPICQN